MTLEELFEVTIPDEQWDNVETVGELFDELERISSNTRLVKQNASASREY